MSPVHAVAAVHCPVCHSDVTKLQRVVSTERIQVLRSAPSVLESFRASGTPEAAAFEKFAKHWRPHAPASGPSNPTPIVHVPVAAATVPHWLPAPQQQPGSLGAAAQLPAAPNGGLLQSFRSAITSMASNKPQATLALPLPNGSTSEAPAPLHPFRGEAWGAAREALSAFLQRGNAAAKPHDPSTLDDVLMAIMNGELTLSKSMSNPRAETLSKSLVPLQALLNSRPAVAYSSEPGPSTLKPPAAPLPASLQVAPLLPPAPVLLPAPLPAQPSVVGPPAISYAPPPPRAQPAPATSPPDSRLSTWHLELPEQDYRRASVRPDGVQNYIWTPHARDFAPDSPRRHETVLRFKERWAAGEPIVIRGIQGRLNWGPKILSRVARSV